MSPIRKPIVLTEQVIATRELEKEIAKPNHGEEKKIDYRKNFSDLS